MTIYALGGPVWIAPSRVFGLVDSLVRTAVWGAMLNEWAKQSNEARPHMALGPGVPEPAARTVLHVNEKPLHRLGARAVVCARSVVGGLHHEYSLALALP